MKKPVIEFTNYTWQYNAQTEPTLHNLNFTIYEGEKVLICGPSGCGKSTIASAINGLIPFSYKGEQQGSLKIMGKETKELSLFDVSKMVGTVLQDSDGQFVGLTVAEDIAFVLENDNIPQTDLFRRVKDAAELVGVPAVLSHAPTEISGGQKQRVSLAGVMIDDVPILLFDEPLANLDPKTGKAAIELIDNIHKQTGVTIIIIEHRIEDVLHRDIDRVLLMHEGCLIADTTPADLLGTNLLIDEGIREPLYITALKYAGVKITPEMQPQNIETLKLDPEDKQKVLNWFRSERKEKRIPLMLPLLEASHINFSYDKERKGQVIKDISVTFNKGEMTAIVGTNGAGKSTFSKLICGFETEDSGSFRLYQYADNAAAAGGRDNADSDNTAADAKTGDVINLSIDLKNQSIKERADYIGYVMQNPNQMISRVMIFDEVALGLKMRQKTDPALTDEIIKQKVLDTLKICGLYEFRNWPVSALSYGQKKRVTIASILALDPKIIILDEPTAGQDYRHYTEIMEFLSDINKKGVTVIMVTHDMHLMLEYCRRGIVFSDGRMIKDSTPSDILTDMDVIERASLKQTSLYDLSKHCGITDSEEFVSCFIKHDEKGKEAF